MKRICTICARGGSQGVRGKNLRKVQGRSLLEITYTQAKKSELFDVIAISSDSAEILAEGRRIGADMVVPRPIELATHTAGKIPAIQHCVRQVESTKGIAFDVMVDLDVTSPLRLVSDINGAVRLLEENPAIDNVITGMVARRSPYFNLVEEDLAGLVDLAKKPAAPILRRQDAPKCFDMNASVYVWRRHAFFASDKLKFGKTKIFVMPEERSIDIDSETDFEFVSFVAEKQERFKDEW